MEQGEAPFPESRVRVRAKSDASDLLATKRQSNSLRWWQFELHLDYQMTCDDQTM